MGSTEHDLGPKTNHKQARTFWKEGKTLGTRRKERRQGGRGERETERGRRRYLQHPVKTYSQKSLKTNRQALPSH
jgi:hypothetical protein